MQTAYVFLLYGRIGLRIKCYKVFKNGPIKLVKDSL